LSSRRAILGLPVLALAGCGFHPMYGDNPRAAATTRGLESVRVGLIPERNGQLLRRRLEERLGAGGGLPQYDLRVGLGYGIEQQGFRRDGSPSRVRITATAQWFLFDTNVPPRLVTTGTDRAFDAYNIPENQFFAADAARQAAERRLVDQLAEDIVRRLAVRFEAGPPQAG
jgi:LPS-assembly lipoprotein